MFISLNIFFRGLSSLLLTSSYSNFWDKIKVHLWRSDSKDAFHSNLRGRTSFPEHSSFGLEKLNTRQINVAVATRFLQTVAGAVSFIFPIPVYRKRKQSWTVFHVENLSTISNGRPKPYRLLSSIHLTSIHASVASRPRSASKLALKSP